MKKTGNLFLILPILAVIVSCSKESLQDGNNLIPETIFVTPSVSDGGTAPVQIDGNNNGGNITCEEVALEKGAEFLFSTGRVEYNNGNFIFENGSTGWPEGLAVTVTDNKSVSFTYNSEKYRVGAVIIKGGNNSNVYYFKNGSTGDAGLTAPGITNNKGKTIIPELGNITFCFICNLQRQGAWGAGQRYTDIPGKWGRYTPFLNEGQIVPLLTEDGIHVGNALIGSIIGLGSSRRMEISLIDGWRFTTENNYNHAVYVQDYYNAPNTYYEPETDPTWLRFYSVNGGTFSWSYVDVNNYYGIYVKVEKSGCDNSSE